MNCGDFNDHCTVWDGCTDRKGEVIEQINGYKKNQYA